MNLHIVGNLGNLGRSILVVTGSVVYILSSLLTKLAQGPEDSMLLCYTRPQPDPYKIQHFMFV